MNPVIDRTESRPATPKICERTVSQILLLPFSGTYSHTSLFKTFIRPLDYYYCGHGVSTRAPTDVDVARRPLCRQGCPIKVHSEHGPAAGEGCSEYPSFESRALREHKMVGSKPGQDGDCGGCQPIQLTQPVPSSQIV